MQDTPQSGRKVTILGAGAWGTAMAMALAARHDVLLWGRDADAMAALAVARENAAYLPGFCFPPALRLTASLDAALAHVHPASGAEALLIAACRVTAGAAVVDCACTARPPN